MKHRTRYYAVIVLLVLLLGCGKGPAETTPDEEPPISSEAPKAAPPGPRTIDVRTPEEFVQAIGPDRILRLVEPEYVLSDLEDRYMEYVRWDPVYDGKTLTVRNLKNLGLVGANDQPARLLTRPRYAFVLNFDNCTNVVLENLVLGHEPEKGGCDSGVVGATECSNLNFVRCDLFGCGTEGLTLNKVSGFLFEDSTIRDCTYGILSARSCKNLVFRRSRFSKNEQYWAMDLHDTRDVLFENCTIEGNRTDQALFQAVSCSNVRVAGGTIMDNGAGPLTNSPGVVVFENVSGIQADAAEPPR